MNSIRRYTHWLARLSVPLAMLLAGCAGTATPTTLHATATPAHPTIATTSGARLRGAITHTLRLADAPAACPVDAAWSPSGSEIAVLATRDTCLVRPATKMPDLLIIYNAQTGVIVRQISLAAILASEKAYVMIDPRFGFSGLSWSPDGASIAVPFFQYIILSSDPRGTGVLIASATSGAVRALAGPSNFGPDPTGHPRFDAATIWNAQSGKQAGSVSVPLPSAQAYQSSADGHIAPAQTSASVPPTSRQFSYWQPGFIAAVPTNQQSAYPVWMFYTATFTRWSSDSHYVITGLMTMNRAGISAGAPTTIDPNDCQAERWPLPCAEQPIPAPDAAFRAVLREVDRAPETNLYPNDAPVAWRPDGAVLATVLPGDETTVVHRALTVTLLDTASGQALGAVTLPVQAAQGDTGMARWPYFEWSPSGKQLSVVNDIDNTVELVTLS